MPIVMWYITRFLDEAVLLLARHKPSQASGNDFVLQIRVQGPKREERFARVALSR